jgi:hypothetical protein
MLGGSGLASAIIGEQLIRMGTAIGELLPLAVAIAISVTMIITTVLMLLSPKAKSRTVGLLVGCFVGVGGLLRSSRCWLTCCRRKTPAGRHWRPL